MTSRPSANRIIVAHIMAGEAGFEIRLGLFRMLSAVAVRPGRPQRMCQHGILTVTIHAVVARLMADQAILFMTASVECVNIPVIQRMNVRLHVFAFMAIQAGALFMAHEALTRIRGGDSAMRSPPVGSMARRSGSSIAFDVHQECREESFNISGIVAVCADLL